MLKRNLVANYIGQGWSALMGLAFVPLYIKYLGIEAYGLIGLFAVLTAWLSLLDLGMTPTIGREMARFYAGAHTPQSIRDLLRTVEIIAYSLAFCIAGAVWFAADWLASDWLRVEMLPTNVVAQVIPIMAWVIGMRFCEGIYRSSIISLQQQVWFNAANAILQTVRYAGVVMVLAYVSSTIAAFFIWQAVISLLTLAIFVIKLDHSLPIAPKRARFSKGAIINVWNFAGGMLGINLLVILLTQVDKLLLSNLLSLQQYGYYMLAGAITAVMPMIIGPTTQAMYPHLVELQAKGNEVAFARVFHQGAQLVTLVTTPLMLVLAVFPHAVIFIWSGDHELANGVAPLLTPLIIGSFLNGLMWMPYQTQLAYGWTRLTIRVNIIAVAILVPSIVTLVPIYGAISAAWIWVALNSCYVLIAAHLMYAKILRTEKWIWYVQDLIWPIFGGLAVIEFCYFVVTMPVETTRIQWAAYLFAIYIIAAIAVLMICNQLRLKAKLVFCKMLLSRNKL